MIREENIRAILECNFAGFKDEIIDNVVKRICELKLSEWIPVSKRLPEDYETVIASDVHEYVYPEARYSKEHGWEWAGDYHWMDLEEVVAWMPLPEAYKPESEE